MSRFRFRKRSQPKVVKDKDIILKSEKSEVKKPVVKKVNRLLHWLDQKDAQWHDDEYDAGKDW